MSARTPVLVFVGAGPRTVSLLERIAANAAELPPPGGLDIVLVDPHPAGGGRIWRRNQSSLLWMNSVARDVTMFPDDSVVMDGPVVAGPPLDQWVAGPGRAVLAAAGLQDQADAFTPDDFASREFQSLYLTWTLERVLASLPSSVRVTRQQGRAVSVIDLPGAGSSLGQRVVLDDGADIDADLVVLAQGYLDRVPTPAEAALSAAADQYGLTYVLPGYTADVDLSGLRPGATVLVRGFGLAFVDLMVLLFQGRGGEFTTGADGELSYRSSGAEPVLHVGSRRGVPYHAKLHYPAGAVPAAGPVRPVYLTPAAVASLAAPTGTADVRTELWPLMELELTAAHYRELFTRHAERTRLPWDQVEPALAERGPQDPSFAALIAEAVPDPQDRFDLAQIDRPLRNRTFVGPDGLAAVLSEYVRADLARRADPRHSADLAVFHALLACYGVLAGAVVAGQISPADRVRYVEGEFHGLFSFLASGPPPRRLAELLALHRAGFVHFAGPDLRIEVADGQFVGRSPAVPGAVVADALVDARLPTPDVRAASDPVISGLLAAGELAAEDLVAADGSALGGGQLLADAQCRAIRADRSVHPRRFLLGASVSGSAGSAGFARPHFNAPGFRQNDRVARQLLELSAAVSDPDERALLVAGAPAGSR